jgi:hypothetical protein
MHFFDIEHKVPRLKKNQISAKKLNSFFDTKKPFDLLLFCTKKFYGKRDKGKIPKWINKWNMRRGQESSVCMPQIRHGPLIGPCQPQICNFISLGASPRKRIFSDFPRDKFLRWSNKLTFPIITPGTNPTIAGYTDNAVKLTSQQIVDNVF